MSGRINILLYSALIILVFVPFFQIEQSESANVYFNALVLMPGIYEIGGSMYSSSGAEVIFNAAGGIQYFILILFPIFGLIVSVFKIVSKNEKLKFILEFISIIVAFIIFIFLIFSVKSINAYELSFGYTGTIFVYSLIFGIKILNFLIETSPTEDEIWGLKGTKKYKRIK